MFICPSEIRPLEERMSDFIYSNGLDYLQVFDDFLSFIIGNFNPELKPNPYWRYTKEQNQGFHEMMCLYFQIMKEMIEARPWYDAFGDLFMSIVGQKAAQYKGQFFTPEHICDLTIGPSTAEKEPEFVCNGFGKRITVSDPTCGSGRMLLAAHAIFIENNMKPAYYVGEDVDHICCKMTAINLMMHGCFGEVVCHNSLTEPEGVNIGYIINEMMYPFPALPSIRIFNEPERFICCRIHKFKREMNERKPEPRQEAPVIKKRSAPVQLELF